MHTYTQGVRQMFGKLKNFLSNTSGNVAVTTVFAMFPLLASVAVTVDYTRYSMQVSSIQASLDAAGVAAGRFASTGADEPAIKAYAETYFKANLDNSIDYADITFDLDLIEGDASVDPIIPTRIQLSGELDYDPILGTTPYFELSNLVHEVITEITLGNRTVEVALVMDNSGSMGSNNRINIMKTETKNLVDKIFNASTLSDLPDPVKFSVVPFAGTVNIGPNNWNRRYMDRNGWSSIHHESLDWNTYRTTKTKRWRKTGFQVAKDGGGWDWLTRMDVFEMLDVDWKGCVEMRPWPYNTTDDFAWVQGGYNTVNNSLDANGDGVSDGVDALFVHYFAPDEPDRKYAYKSGSSTNHQTDDDGYENSYLYDFRDYDKNNPGSTYQIWENIEVVNAEPNIAYDQSGSTRQINRSNWMFKYQSRKKDSYPYTSTFDQDDESSWYGPNFGCTVDPITPLTTTKSTVDSAINAMDANGITNIQQGLTWGWRTLSDNEPFTEGRENDDKENMKYIVLLTDGNNFYGTDGDSTPNQTEYGAWGYARTSAPYNPMFEEKGIEEDHNRWLDGLSASDLTDTIYSGASFDTTPESNGDFELIMNAHTNQSCNNIKNDGISIFTIAFDVSSGSSVKNLLEACSGSGVKDGKNVIASGIFYYDVNGGQLEMAMNQIADQIAQLHISK